MFHIIICYLYDRALNINNRIKVLKEFLLFSDRNHLYYIFIKLKFVCGYFYGLEKNICQNKSCSFSSKIGGGKNFQTPFQTILRLKKKKKQKWHGPLSYKGGKGVAKP